MSDKKPSRESDAEINKSLSSVRGEDIRTFIVSVPKGNETPKVKIGHIKELTHQDTIEDIERHIEDVERIVQNIQVIHVECSKCVGSFKNIFNNCRIKSKVSVV